MPLLRTGEAFLLILCFLGAFIYVSSHAWLEEDAFFTFRVIDNFVHGYGLRWNIDERVQVYTHPLWMLSLVPFYMMVNNVYVASFALSAFCGILCVGVMWNSVAASRVHKLVLILLPLLCSATFNDYAASGLENPLSCLLVAWFWQEFLMPRTPGSTRLYLIAALCLLTRYDHVFVLLPALLYHSWQGRQVMDYRKLLYSLSPLLLWALFSLVYYGFLFPNTKYAKLNANVPPELLHHWGWNYIWNFLFYDPFSAFILFLCGLFCLSPRLRKNVPACKITVMWLGIVLHVGYIIHIGGDYMAGRFFSTSFITAVMLLLMLCARLRFRQLSLLAGVMLAFQLAHLQSWLPYAHHRAEAFKEGIVDERVALLGSNGMFSDKERFFRRMPSYSVISDGQKKRRETGKSDTVQVYVYFSGMYGYCAGPHVIIIDNLALPDALLARLPFSYIQRSGHYFRNVPEGYEEARRTGSTANMAAPLAAYYEKLRLVTSAPLFSAERWKAIIGFQLGRYDGLLREYTKK